MSSVSEVAQKLIEQSAAPFHQGSRSWSNEFKQILLFGDSITQQSLLPANGAWATEIAQGRQREVDIVRRGLSGYTTRNACASLPLLFPPGSLRNTVAVVVFFGANDAAIPGSIQHIPLDEYAHNLRVIIAFFQKLGIDRKSIILVTPPPIDDSRREWRKNAVTGEYAKMGVEVAQSEGTLSVNLWQQLQDSNDEWASVYLNDGLHLTPSGGHVVGSAINTAVEAVLAHVGPLSMVMPTHEEARSNDLASIFASHSK